jgi:nucleoside-diphosphate-sugar epimerase
MRILLTGATGKLGNSVARQLIARGDHVVALVRDPVRARELFGAGSGLAPLVELIPGDVTDPDSLKRAARGVDAAVNCMGIFEQWQRHLDVFNRVNAQGAANVARAARAAGARRIVHTSTYDVFAAPRGGTVSERALADYEKGTPYERSKQLAERLVLAEAGAELEVVITNPAGIYGPGRWAAAGWDGAIRDAIRGRLPAVPPGGLSLLWVESAAAAHLAALDRGRPGERYLLADGYATVREICAAAVEAAGRGRAPWQLSLGLARGLARAGEAVADATGRPPLISRGQLHFLQWQARADCSKAQAELGFEPSDWRAGIARTVTWMEREGRI